MIGTLFAGAIISLIIVAAAAYLLLKFVRQEIGRIQTLQQNQIQSQEAQLQFWKAAQEKHLSELEQQLFTQVQQLQQLQTAQKVREETENQRIQTLISQHEAAINQHQATSAKAYLEHELSQLPRLEDVPLPGPDHQQQHGFTAQRNPPNFQGHDLSRRDLSSRYLSHADLRQTNLSLTKLFMADLSWANLAEANLREAELSATNLTYANLRGAVLRGANLLVADLNHAILIGADLRDAHGLTLEQVATTIYDATTLFDPELDSKLPQKARTHQPGETGHKPESADFSKENTNRIPAVPKKQESQTTTQPEPQASTPQVFQTPTGDVLPMENTVPSAYQTPLEIPSFSLPSQEALATFPENSEAH